MRWSANRRPDQPPTTASPARGSIGRPAPAAVLVTGVLLLAGCQQGSSPFTGEWQRDGRAVTTEQIESYQGDDHCDWEEVTFLQVMWPPQQAASHTDSRQFVRDPEGRLGVPALKAGYQDEGKLPADAAASGFVNGGTELWFAASDQDTRAYLVADDGRVEVWPRATETFGCD